VSPKANERFRTAMISTLAGIIGAILAVAGVVFSAGKKSQKLEIHDLQIMRLESRMDHIYEVAKRKD